MIDSLSIGVTRYLWVEALVYTATVCDLGLLCCSAMFPGRYEKQVDTTASALKTRSPDHMSDGKVPAELLAVRDKIDDR